jgi:hypothetical protein
MEHPLNAGDDLVMLDEFSTIQGRETFSNFLFEPLIVIDVARHQVVNNLIRTPSRSGSNAIEFVFQLRGEANLHAVSVGPGSWAVKRAARTGSPPISFFAGALVRHGDAAYRRQSISDVPIMNPMNGYVLQSPQNRAEILIGI